MDELTELGFYLKEYEKPFSGFDFSYVERTGRIDGGRSRASDAGADLLLQP